MITPAAGDLRVAPSGTMRRRARLDGLSSAIVRGDPAAVRIGLASEWPVFPSGSLAYLESPVIVCVPDVLTAQELATIRGLLSSTPYVDGASSAGWSAREVKHNQQADLNSAGYAQMAQIVGDAFQRNGLLQTALMPSAVTHALLNRYGVGMQYGPHVDAAVMGGVGNAVRTDIAITLFLSAPTEYDGGELTIYTGGMGAEFKLDAGAAIAYPANTLHHVKPVTRGARNAAILWVQSQVRDPARRELLWDLFNAKQQIHSREGKSATFDAVSKSHANLVRMWADV